MKRFSSKDIIELSLTYLLLRNLFSEKCEPDSVDELSSIIKHYTNSLHSSSKKTSAKIIIKI